MAAAFQCLVLLHLLRRQALGGKTEILVVDDGSKDRTAEVAESFQKALPGLRVISNGVNRGKGFSVRHGMLEARGRSVLFTDADLSAPIEEAPKLLEALKTYDVAIGSRALDRSLITVHESRFREFAGMIFNTMVRVRSRVALSGSPSRTAHHRNPGTLGTFAGDESKHVPRQYSHVSGRVYNSLERNHGSLSEDGMTIAAALTL